MYTFNDLLTFVSVRIQDASGGTVTAQAVCEYANEALRRLRRKFEIPPSTRREQIELFNGVYRYPYPTGAKGALTLTGQDDMPDILNFERTTADDFWRAYLDHNRHADERNGNSRDLLIRLVSPSLTDLQMNACELTTGWTTFGDASNLRVDGQEYKTGSASLAFDLTPALGYGGLEFNGTLPDLSGLPVYLNGTGFFWNYLPSYTSFTTITFQWGTDSSNCWTRTATKQYSQSALAQGWNQLGFAWTSATVTGSPSSQSPKWMRIRYDYPLTMPTQSALRIDDVRMKQPKKCWLKYASDYMVVDGTTGDFKESFASGTDVSSYFSCDSSFTDLLGYMVLESVFTYSVKDQDARALNQNLLVEAEKSLLETNPSEKPPISYSYMDNDDLGSYENG